MDYRTNELLKLLKTNKVTFYKYYNIYKKTLEKLRRKQGGIYFYNDEFIKVYKELISGKIIENEQVNKINTSINQNVLDELKSQYSEQISELRQDKQFLQEKLTDELNKNTNQNSKVETLLIQLLKVSNNKNLIENKNIDPIQKSSEIIEEVKINKTKLKKENKSYKISLCKSNEQLEEYNNFKNEKDDLLRDLKSEYNKLKFYNFMKKKKYQKKINEISSKEFQFIKYVV